MSRFFILEFITYICFMSKITTIDQAGLDFIKQEEGCVLHPYRDQAGVPTIGIGMTYYPDTGKTVTMNDPHLTQEQADNLFLLMVKPRLHTVSTLTREDLTQNQYNALVDFEYNTGHLNGSTLLKLVNAKQDPAPGFLMWDKIHVDGVLKEDEGLKERREREIKLYKTA